MRSILKKTLFLFIVIFSIGWIIPLYLSINAIIRWNELGVVPFIFNPDHRVINLSTFPFMAFSKFMLIVACIWLAAVIILWIALKGRHFLFLKKQPQVEDAGKAR